ncbi:hypothetical protein SSX86_018637 [Deinandra increscens subsp. villosa]|uniref:Cytochrome P450 n=1 Tax=Deinandra increscens subsp. villosa TaxID=3103831 RepID=A0AAP0GTQ7_9ASTR
MDIAFSPHSGHWKEMRKLLVSEFMGPKRAKLSNHVLVTEMERIIRLLSSHPPATEVNLSNMFLEIVKQMVCKVAFGSDYRRQPVKGPSWDVMLGELTMELLNGSVGDSFPFLGYFIDQFSGWNRRLNDGFKNLDTYIDTIIDDHLKHNTKEISEEDKDFVHSLLDISSKETDSGYRLNHVDLKALVMDILTGGIHTTVVTLIWVMSEINRNPRVMQKLQNEIRNCTGKIEKVGELDTTKMTYLKMVVKETLRLHPPAPLMVPHALSHTQIEGYAVFPSTTVLINAWGIARDPSNWGENVSEFYPERFENVEGDFGRDRFEMLPFGGGRRSCPAMNIAPANVEFVIASLVYWFNWELPNGMKSQELNIENGGTLVLRKNVPLCLVPTKHKWED